MPGRLGVRGFTAPVAHTSAGGAPSGAACVIVGRDGDDLVLGLRHADGTTLITYLSERQMHRLGDLIQATGDQSAAPIDAVTLQ